MRGERMPEELETYLNAIQKFALNRTNMTEEEAWSFAFRCWQLNFHFLPNSGDKCKEVMFRQDESTYLYDNTCKLLNKLSKDLLGPAYDEINQNSKSIIDDIVAKDFKY